MPNTLSKFLCSTVFLYLVSSGFTGVFAHGSIIPVNGGVVRVAGEMTFELVAKDNSIELYLVDDGDDVETAKMQAKLKIADGDNASEVVLLPAGGNRFSAEGTTLPPGSKVLALVTLEDTYSKISANFVMDK